MNLNTEAAAIAPVKTSGLDFSVFKAGVAEQFERLRRHALFRVRVDKDELWTTYLSSFPEGSNPLFRERTEHDCSGCKQFVRALGGVVAIVNGQLASIWDVQVPSQPAYQAVADALSALVKSRPIEDKFLHFERSAGVDKNFEELANGVKTWTHFFVNIPTALVVKGADIPTALAGPRESKGVLLRGLTEITDDAIATVLELIAQNSLYRGEEHKALVESFRALKETSSHLTDTERDLFAWGVATSGGSGALCRIRNTVIGTLLTDLSTGVDLEDAVKMFESKVAPANYKRPTALVTKAMIEKAKQTVDGLGLTSALARRFAHLDDITVNNILFADRSTKKKLAGDVFDDLAAATPTKSKTLDKVEELPIEKFLADVLPRAESVEVLFENRHQGNLVSLIAPEDSTSGMLFKWGNRFSWSYQGEMADSIKERVKKAGGSVEGDLCCRLAWNYTDDLDLHMGEHSARYEIYYGNRRQLSPNGGMLDLDANGADGYRADPAENIFYRDRRTMRDGIYQLMVHNYHRRSDGRGFEVEIEFEGQAHHIAYEKALPHGQHLTIAKIAYSRAKGFEILESLPSSQTSKTLWGLPTQTFHRVDVALLSPNYWDERAVGNKHYFFMLHGCVNDGIARGFFNEFLKEDLTPHRKVLEMVGGKMKVAASERQLSGLGFSSTQKSSVVCRVKGSFTRTVRVTF